MREITKQVKHEIDGKEVTFQINKMNAMKGSYLMKFCAEKLLPLFNGLKETFKPVDDDADADAVAEERTQQVIEIIPKALASLTEDELYTFEKMCLNTVDVLLPSGWKNVMVGDDFWYQDIEYDAITVLVLCYDVIEFNLNGFFGGKGLSSLLPNLNTKQ